MRFLGTICATRRRSLLADYGIFIILVSKTLNIACAHTGIRSEEGKANAEMQSPKRESHAADSGKT